MEKLIKTIKLTFDLKLLTGLHIGSGNDNIKIGGIDSSVIKNPLNNEPYIPGSSLKGKMRYLLGVNKGVSNDLENEEICNIFGKSADNKTNIKPTKIIVRDLPMTKEWRNKMEEFKQCGINFTEEKVENTIDRGNSGKSKPRFIERVPSGVEFNGEIVLKIFENDSEEEMKQLIEDSLRFIENDALGGSGSRGYGQIQIINKEWKQYEYNS